MEPKDEDPTNILRKAHPDCSPEQLKEAEEALDQYFEVVMRIYERIWKEPKLYEEFKAMRKKRRRERSNEFVYSHIYITCFLNVLLFVLHTLDSLIIEFHIN